MPNGKSRPENIRPLDKRVPDAEQARDARHRRILDSATDFAIISTDLDGIITSWNEGAHRVFGWSEQDMLGQHIRRIFTPEDAAAGAPEAEMRRARSEGHAPDERWHLRRSGDRFWGSGQVTPLRSAEELTGFVKVLRDHTAQKRADEDLKLWNEFLERQVAERTRERNRIWRNSRDLLLSLTPDGMLRSASPASLTLLGREPDELIGQHFTRFVHADDIGPTRAALDRATAGPVDHLENRLLHKDGTYRWFAWRAAPEDGVVYANGRDITIEKNQAEELLVASQTRLRLALEAGGMGGWEWDIATRQFSWLHGTAMLHGMPASDGAVVIAIDDYLRLIHPDDRVRVGFAMARAASECSAQTIEYRLVWPDGSVHWIEARGEVLKDEDGTPKRMTGVSVDITARKRAEDDLKFLAMASVELAALVDPQSTLDKLAYLAVPTFADWCAIDLLEDGPALKRVAVAHVDPKKVALAQEIDRRYPTDPAQENGVWQIIRDGKAELVSDMTDDMLDQIALDAGHLAVLKELGLRSYIGVPLAAHGKIFGAVTFVSAESGRRYTPQDLALAEDLARRAAIAIENAHLYRTLKESDRRKDVFLATLAHELRNPLAALVNGLAIMELAPNDHTRLLQAIQPMGRQLGQLTRLVDDLLDISRITNGKIALRQEPTSLSAILRDAVETSRAQIEASRHALTVTLPDAPTPLHADPTRLAQVFSNLLTNAAKYTNPGGRIDVRLEAEPDAFTVRIKDNGLGIAPAMLKRIFSMFAQVDHPVERNQGGLGIGLSLVKGLVEMHGGRVEAKSEGLGKGSEFIVHLPRKAEDRTAVPIPAPRPADGGAPLARAGRRMLVVDDNIDAANTLAEILRMLGHEVSVVHDGLSAVSAASVLRPDMILLDIGLPGIDGYEAARRIRATAAGRSTILIALTGWGQAQDVQQALAAGFDHHWVKPVSLEKLKALSQAR